MVAITFFVGILMGALGGILMKVGATKIGQLEINSVGQLVHYIFVLLTNPYSLAGILLYFMSAVVWSYLLIKLDISFVQPILALTYVVTPILAIFILKEHVPMIRWLGIAVIIMGVYIVARTAR